MAKRFVDTKIWDKAWFRRLTPKNKLIWIYLLTKCDHAGIWDSDWEAAEFFIGEKVTYDELPEEITDKMEYIKGENQYFIPSFIQFQYGELKENSKPHLSVIKRLNDKGLHSVPDTLKYKDKVEDKVKVKTIEERGIEFIEKCEKLCKKHDMSKTLLKQFTDFWTESNEGGKKMKFEMQQTFDISRRLAKWKSNDIEWNGSSKKSIDKFIAKFKLLDTGFYRAYCSSCGNKEYPSYEWQVKNGSSCCAVEYLPEKPK
tara:strand:- start:6127 stop:6897 length:771 start_codon:yes stop_codon:yes gene_type:complete